MERAISIPVILGPLSLPTSFNT